MVIWASILLILSDVCSNFQGICEGFQRFCTDFHGFFQDFPLILTKSKILGKRFAPLLAPPPTPVVQHKIGVL